MFTRFDKPKKSCKNFSEMCQRSVVATFNSVQEKLGKGTCSSATALSWLKENRPKTSISPQKLDYCDLCVEYKEQAKRYRQIGNRLRESGNASETEVDANYSLASSYDQLLHEHKEDAQNVLDHYRTIIKECSETWKLIVQLTKQDPASLTAEEVEQLASLKRNFSVVISFDYQQNKNLPHWGYSPQPGETYYKMKLTCNVFGIVDHRSDHHDFSTVFICDERASGPKSADTTISFLDRYVHQLPSWISGLTLVADNAGTNKNYYLLSWAMELVRKNKFKQVWILFLIPGHSKFSPDILFSKIGNTFNCHDVFTVQELAGLVERYALCLVSDNASIFRWRDYLSSIYLSFDGIKTYHDFRIKRSLDGQSKLMFRERQYTGSYHTDCTKLREIGLASDLLLSLECYSPLKLNKEKVAHLSDMYDKYIPVNRRLPWLPPPQVIQPQNLVVPCDLGPVTSEAAKEHQSLQKRRKKRNRKK